MRRFGFIKMLAGLLILSMTVLNAQSAEIKISYLGQQIIPNEWTYKETTVGGLSSLEYNPKTNRYIAICDDRSKINRARFYEMDLTFDETGFHKWKLTDRTFMKRPDGSFFPKPSFFGKALVDPEALKLSPSGKSYYWTSEGHAKEGVQPFIREMDLKGEYIRDFTVSDKYLVSESGNNGVRDNLAFEAMTIGAGQKTITVSTEGPLHQDGPEATADAGAVVRFLSLDISTGQPLQEYVYPVDPVHKETLPFGNFSINGVVDILAISSQKFIVVERSFSTGVGLSVKLYLADFTDSTNVLGMQSLKGQRYQTAQKTLLLDLTDLGIDIDNIEGMSFGKPLKDGRRSLILISDDNFRSAQVSQILVFALEGEF